MCLHRVLKSLCLSPFMVCVHVSVFCAGLYADEGAPVGP